MNSNSRNFKTLWVLIGALVVGAVAYRAFDPAVRRAEVRAASASILGQALSVAGGIQTVTDALARMQAAERAGDWEEAVTAARDGEAAVKVILDGQAGLANELDGVQSAKELYAAGGATTLAIQEFDAPARELFAKYAEGYEARHAGGNEPILVDVESFNRALRALDAAANELVRVSSSR